MAYESILYIQFWTYFWDTFFWDELRSFAYMTTYLTQLIDVSITAIQQIESLKSRATFGSVATKGGHASQFTVLAVSLCDRYERLPG